jgi:hypothetical protein
MILVYIFLMVTEIFREVMPANPRRDKIEVFILLREQRSPNRRFSRIVDRARR